MPIGKYHTEDDLIELIKVTKGSNRFQYKRKLKIIQEGKKVRQENIEAIQFEDLLKENMEALNDKI